MTHIVSKLTGERDNTIKALNALSKSPLHHGINCGSRRFKSTGHDEINLYI